MAPTIQTGAAADRDRKQRLGERKSDLVCRVKYCNQLPDIPFDPKFITYPFPSNRFVEYKPTSLERHYKHDLLTEHDLGVTIDLINPDTYAVDPEAILHPDDEKLLEEDALTPQDSKRSRHHNKTVPWLKKTEYISNEFNRYGHSSEKTETKVGFNVKRKFKDENVYMDKNSQIAAINKTFSDAKTLIEKHYSKPGVYPVETFPVFPDFELWRYPFAQVMFDTDPAPSNQTEEMSQAMIRGVMDESGEQFVAYFLPTEETIKKRKRDNEEETDYKEEEEYEYKIAREYNWNVKNKASKGYEENYFFVFRDGAIYYNELETRVRLSKKRVKPGMPPNNSLLVVQHRPFSEPEYEQQKSRLRQLDPSVPEEEEEEEEAEEGDDEKTEAKSGSDEEANSGSEDEAKSENEAKSGSENEAEKESEDEAKSGSENEAKSGSENEAKSGSDDDNKSGSEDDVKSGSDNDDAKSDNEAESEKEEESADDNAKSDNEEKEDEEYMKSFFG